MRTKFLLMTAAVICFASAGLGEDAKNEAGKKNAGKLTTYNIHMSGVS